MILYLIHELRLPLSCKPIFNFKFQNILFIMLDFLIQDDRVFGGQSKRKKNPHCIGMKDGAGHLLNIAGGNNHYI